MVVASMRAVVVAGVIVIVLRMIVAGVVVVVTGMIVGLSLQKTHGYKAGDREGDDCFGALVVH